MGIRNFDVRYSSIYKNLERKNLVKRFSETASFDDNESDKEFENAM